LQLWSVQHLKWHLIDFAYFIGGLIVEKTDILIIVLIISKAMAHLEWIEDVIVALCLVLGRISKHSILVEPQDVLRALSTCLPRAIVVLVLDSGSAGIEAADYAVAEQAGVLIQMTVDDWSAHLSIHVSNRSWEFAS
jgi:hypothetical protein